MSVKTIVYSSDDEDRIYFSEFGSQKKSRKFVVLSICFVVP